MRTSGVHGTRSIYWPGHVLSSISWPPRYKLTETETLLVSHRSSTFWLQCESKNPLWGYLHFFNFSQTVKNF